MKKIFSFLMVGLLLLTFGVLNTNFDIIPVKAEDDGRNYIQNLSDHERNIVQLQEIYNEVKTSDLISYETIKGIVKTELADNATDVSTFQYKDLEQVSLDDFEVISVNAENSKAPVADGVTFSNPDSANTTIIEVVIQEPVHKDGRTYKITGYVVLIDKIDPNLESGITIEQL